MKTNLVRILALSALAAAAGFAQNAQPSAAGTAIVGVWDVSVTVVNCQTHAPIRNIHAVQAYQADGAFSEITDSGSRGSSIGYWQRQGQTYGAAYSFYRYNADGSFAALSKATNTITVSSDGSQFSVTGTIQDYDANHKLVSTGCVTQTGKRPSSRP